MVRCLGSQRCPYCSLCYYEAEGYVYGSDWITTCPSCLRRFLVPKTSQGYTGLQERQARLDLEDMITEKIQNPVPVQSGDFPRPIEVRVVGNFEPEGIKTWHWRIGTGLLWLGCMVLGWRVSLYVWDRRGPSHAAPHPCPCWYTQRSTGEPIQDRDLVQALEHSLSLQSHYAKLLNQFDGGERRGFSSVTEWMDRLRETGKT